MFHMYIYLFIQNVVHTCFNKTFGFYHLNHGGGKKEREKFGSERLQKSKDLLSLEKLTAQCKTWHEISRSQSLSHSYKDKHNCLLSSY